MRLATAVLLSLAGLTATAADSFPAATSSTEADADFPFVGEYVGDVDSRRGGGWQRTHIGLQVAALGDGRFEATEYLGGLPGAGWDRRDRVTLVGRREGNQVRIDADPVDILLDGLTGRVGEPNRTSVYGTVRRIRRVSPTLGQRPPRGAVILFDGHDTDRFASATLAENGLLTQGAETAAPYAGFDIHVEFLLPYMPAAAGQSRANSGVYLQRRYEVQILDSFGDDPVFDNAAALYRTKPADLNMSFPPLVWQTYDIAFRPAVFDGDRKTANARVTVRHNGVIVQNDYEIPSKTGAGKPEGPEPMPILLQDHGNPVRFRNVWLVEHRPADPAAPSACPTPCCDNLNSARLGRIVSRSPLSRDDE